MLVFCAAFGLSATAELSPALPPPSLPPPSAPYYEVDSKEQLLDIFSESRMEASADVVVASGTIIELEKQLSCEKGITVTIRGSGEGVTFDGKDKIGLFKVSGGCSLTLERLNLVNGKTNGDGGAVYVKNGILTLMDSTVTNCKGDWGGALYVEISYNYKVRVERSTFTSCSAEYGGAVYVQRGWREPGEVSLINSEIADCHATWEGGAVWVDGGEVSLLGSKISSCSAAEGGAISMSSGNARVEGSTFTNCSADKGGAVNVRRGKARVEDSTFTSCSADLGGAVYVEGSEVSLQRSELSLINSEISNCIATEYGGGLYSAGGRTRLSKGTLISKCSAPEGQGSSIFLLGGGVSYTLAAPAGHWLPNALCEVYREACPTEWGKPIDDCPNHRDNCALTDETDPSPDEKEEACGRHSSPERQAACSMTVDEPWLCQIATFVQPCNWQDDPFILGENLYQLPLEPVERDFPYRCAAGLNASLDPGDQSSSLCAGPCPPGTWSAIGSGSCTDCEPGFYAQQERQAECRRCPHPLFSDPGSVFCSMCMEGYYLSNFSADPYDMIEFCHPCPGDANCSSPSATLETLPLKAGFWRASKSSDVLYECRRFGGDGDAGEKRCAGGSEFGIDGSGYCAPGFKGPECQLCEEEDHYLTNGDTCSQCAAVGELVGNIVGLFVGLFVSCAIAAWVYSTTSLRRKPCIGPFLRFADRAVAAFATFGLTPKLKILLGFYQVALVLDVTYSAQLPEEFTTPIDRLNDWISLNWAEAFLPFQCSGSRVIAVTLLPVGLIALLLLSGVALRVYRWHATPLPRQKLWPKEVALGLLDFLPASLVLVFLCVPGVNAYIFGAWSCQAYDDPDPEHAKGMVSYLRRDPSIECFTDKHQPTIDRAIIFAGVWVGGSLILYSSLLAACYTPLRAKVSSPLTRATAFLRQEYTTTFFWWEALELARKLILNGIVLLIREERAFLRLVVAVLLSSCYLTALAATQPYRKFEDYALAVATNLVLLVNFVLAGWCSIFLNIEERSGKEEAITIFGFSSDDWIADTMLGLTFGVTGLFVVLAAAIGAIAAQRRRERDRELEETNRALADAALEMQGVQCTFLFLDADVIRSGRFDEAGYKTTLPRLQEMQAAHPEWIQRRVLKRHLAYGRHAYRGEILAVSHRWEQPDAPDASGAQLRAIREHLQSPAGLEVGFVWYDYWCMPQGERTPTEKVDFKRMLQNVNLLYLGCSVLILQELSYLSRFWTQFEAWCSMQAATGGGLGPAPAAERRCTVVPIHQATEGMASELIMMWASRSVDEAIDTLASPDVTVTNQSDKELQLYKLRELDSLVQEAVAQCESEAADPTVVEIAPAPDRGSNSIFERAE